MGLCFILEELGTRFTDANWGSGDDRRSIGGYTFILHGAAISWNSKKQCTVALSSTEAEYMALTQAVKESIWLQAILGDLGARRHMKNLQCIGIDKQGALALAKNPQFNARTKHIDIQHNFVRECIEKGQITLGYCSTIDMTGDIFTKALPPPALVRHSLGLGLLDQQSTTIQDIEAEEEYGDGSAHEGRCF